MSCKVRSQTAHREPTPRVTCIPDHERSAHLLQISKATGGLLVDFCSTFDGLPPDKAGSPPREVVLLNAPCACACCWAEPHLARASLDAILLMIEANHHQAKAAMKGASRLHIRLEEQCPRCWSGLTVARRKNVCSSRDSTESLYAAIQHAVKLVGVGVLTDVPEICIPGMTRSMQSPL